MANHNLSERIIVVQKKEELHHLSKAISDHFNIKLTRSRERLSDSMGYNSYNHLVASLKTTQFLVTKATDFKKNLSLSLTTNHQLIEPIEDSFIYSLSSNYGCIFSHCKFTDFLTYAFLVSNQRFPLINNYYDNIRKHLVYSDSYFFDPEQTESDHDNELHLCLHGGFLNQELSRIIDIELKSMQSTYDATEDEFHDKELTITEKQQLLYSFRKLVIDLCSPHVIHIDAIIIAHTKENSFPELSCNFRNYKKTTLSDSSGGYLLISNYGQNFRDLLRFNIDAEYIDDNLHDIHSLSRFSILDVSTKNDETIIIDGDDDCFIECSDSDKLDKLSLPKALRFTLFDKSYMFVSDSTERDYGLYRTPKTVDVSDEYDGDSSMQFTVIFLAKTGAPLSAQQKNAIYLDICESTKNTDTVGVLPLISLNNLRINSSELNYKLGEVFHYYLNKNKDRIIELHNGEEIMFVCLQHNNVYRPLGLDIAIMNSSSELSINKPFGIPDMAGFCDLGLSCLIKGFNKNKIHKVSMLNTYQNNLLKNNYFVKYDDDIDGCYIVEDSEPLYKSNDSNEIYYTESVDPLLELFHKFFNYTLNIDDFLSKIKISSCHNVYIVAVDDDQSSNLCFHVFGYNSQGSCLLNVAYYDETLIHMNDNFHSGVRLFYKKISEQISGELFKTLSEGSSPSDDGYSDCIFNVYKEIDLIKRYFSD